jgi:predicted O-methyltransferase YrrM
MESATGALIGRVGKRFLHKWSPASLGDLVDIARQTYTDPYALIARASPDGVVVPADAIAEITREHQGLSDALRVRYERERLVFPERWAVEAGTSFLLYALVRIRKPAVVVEVGVANGHSSYYILNALLANGQGKLYSFDIESDVGGLLGSEERASWELRQVSYGRSGATLDTQLTGLPAADLCFHDGDHQYLGQRAEFERLWKQLNPEGVLVCDDVDASHALMDFVEAVGEAPEILVDRRKVVGIVMRRSLG